MKTKNVVALGFGLLTLPMASAMADSISPSSFSAALGVGGSVTIHKDVTVTADGGGVAKADVYFLADSTGSMGSSIANVQAAAGSVLAAIAGMGDIQFAVGDYKDVGDPYVFNQAQDFTASQAAAQAAINGWSASGGGDTPEGQLYAIQQLGNTASWRPDAEHILVWFGDAPGHDPDNGATLATATAAVVGKNIQVQAIDVGAMNSTGQATALAGAVAGGTVNTGIPANLAAQIQALIGTALTTYNTVSLDTSAAPAGVSVSFTPASHVGSWDRSVDRTFGFDVTFTGVAAGTYDFPIYATVDGGRVATELDHITVPEPASLSLMGLGLAALTASRRRKMAA